MDEIQRKLVMQTENAGLDNTFTFLLMVASENGFTTEAEDLIKKGADVNSFNIKTQKRALDLASENGNTDIVRLLINKGANIEDQQSYFSPLHSAVQNGHTETAALLIENGAKINKTGSFEMSALHLASQNGHNNTVKMLIQKGANVNHIPVKGFEPALMLAARLGHTDVAETLIEGGANIDYQDNQLQDVSVLETALMCGKTDVAKLLIEKGAKIDGALMQAFKKNCKEVVVILLNKEIDVKHKDKYGKTLLMIAATCGQTELMSNLIEIGSDIDEKDNEGMTALMHAVNNGCLKAVEMLIEKKAHVNEKSKDGRSPLMFACASNLQCKDVIEMLIEHGAYVNEGNKDGKTALMYASMYGCTGNVEKLIEHGANINERCKEGWTGLMYASQGCTDTVKLLIDKEADLNIKAINGDTALILTTRFAKKEIVELLLDKGADVHIQGKCGLSAQQIAMINFAGQNILKMFVEKKSIMSTSAVKDCEALTKPMRTDTMPTGHDTMRKGNDTMPKGHDTMPTGHKTMLTGQDAVPTGHDTMTPGHDTNIPKDSPKQSGQGDEVLTSLSHGIQQQIKLDGSEINDLSGTTRENLEKTEPVTQEKDEILLCETHRNPSMQSKKRKRTKHNRCQSVHKDAPSPKGASSSGSKVTSSKDSSRHGTNVIFNISSENEELQTRTLKTQHVGPSKDCDVTLSSDNTDKLDKAFSNTANQKSPDAINKRMTDSLQIQLDTAALILGDSTNNDLPKRRKSFTKDDTTTRVQKEYELPECTSSDMKKVQLQRAEFFSNDEHETVNAELLQAAKYKYLPQQNHFVFNVYYIEQANNVYIQSPSLVKIKENLCCFVDSQEKNM